jgi:uncharacterized protein YbjT (DUF2867 family)
MVGQGVLREALLDREVRRVTAVGRTPSGASHPKLSDVVAPDLFDLSAHSAAFAGADACLYCLGVTSVGLTEEAYSRITYELTASVVATLRRVAPDLTFVFVSGRGSDSTEKGSIMWARVKGRAENAVLGAGFRGAYVFRPGVIQPMHGIRSRTGIYNVVYAVFRPLVPLIRFLSPGSFTTTEQMGRAMLRVAKAGYSKPILEMADITAL